MTQYVCSVCAFVYDEAAGIPDTGIEAGTKWEDIPENWKCPVCGAGKDAFSPKEENRSEKKQKKSPHVDRALSPMEMSIICSNLARGCEKQYLPEQSDGFRKLAEFFRSKVDVSEQNDTGKLLELIEQDLLEGYPYANEVAAGNADRGALRSLVWSEKVTRMLQSLLNRYEKEGNRMLEHTGVYVCTICGFVYVGDEPPEKCPVCKVPSWKFEKVEGRAS